MAILLEASFEKDLILERYMNTVYLAQKGDMAFHGFASGSLFYFDKNVEDLKFRGNGNPCCFIERTFILIIQITFLRDLISAST